MSVIIKTGEFQYKGTDGTYHGINTVAEKKVEDQINDLNSTLDSVESQRQTMIASIASVAGQGTDTTFTQSGVAADAKAVGDIKSALNPLSKPLIGSKSSSGGINYNDYPLIRDTLYKFTNNGSSRIKFSVVDNETTGDEIFTVDGGQSKEYIPDANHDGVRAYFNGSSSFVIDTGRVLTLEKDASELFTKSDDLNTHMDDVSSELTLTTMFRNITLGRLDTATDIDEPATSGVRGVFDKFTVSETSIIYPNEESLTGDFGVTIDGASTFVLIFDLYKEKNGVLSKVKANVDLDGYIITDTSAEYRVEVRSRDYGDGSSVPNFQTIIGNAIVESLLHVSIIPNSNIVKRVRALESGVEQAKYGFELGAYSGDDLRVKTNNNSRGRTGIFYLDNGKHTVSINNNAYEFHLNEQIFSGDTQTTTTLTPSYKTTFDFVSKSNANYRVVIRRRDQESMASDDLSDVFLIASSETIGETYASSALYAYIDNIKQNVADGDYVFCLSADNHYDEMQEAGAYQLYYAETIAKVAKGVGAKAIINLGDISNSDIDQDATSSNYDAWVNRMRLAKIVNAFLCSRIPFLYAIGHHELFPYIGITNGESVYGVEKKSVCDVAHRSLLYTPVYQNGSSSYPNYYIDDSTYSLRLVFLDGVSIRTTGYSYATIEFLKTALIDVPSGYRIICFSHTPTRASAQNGTTVYGGNIELTPEQLPNGISSYSDTIESVLNEYVEGGGVVLGFFHGHVHIDNIVQEEGMQFKLIAENCQKVGAPSASQFNAITAGGANKKRWTGRTNADDSGYSFDTCVIHNNTIKMFRYGAGEDRIIT